MCSDRGIEIDRVQICGNFDLFVSTDAILSGADENDVVFLVVGDPLG